MLSRNNNKLLIHKLEPKKQRFAIRKISVGVASVLIGFTFAGFSGVSADEATTTAKDHLKTEATAESSSVPTKEVELTSSDEAQAKEVEQTTSAETPAKEAETTPVTDDKAQVAEDTKEQAPAQAVTAEETSEPTTSTEKQTVAPADENEASETQTFNVEKQAEPQAKVDLTDSKVAYAAAPTQDQDQQEEGFSVTDPDYSKYTYGKTNLQTLIDDLGIDYKNSEYVFQWIASTDWERGIIFTVDRGRDADGNVILTGNGSFNAYEYSFLDEYHITKAKTVIQKGQQTLNFGQVINDESKDAIAVDHFYSKIDRGFFYRTQKSYLPIFVGGHSGIESNTGDGYTTLSIYTPQVVEQKAKINNGKIYKTQTGLTGQNYKTGVPKSAKVEEGKFLYAENSEGTMSEFHKGVVLVNNYHNGVTVRYTELDNQGTMQYEFLDNRGFAKKLYNESTHRNESRGILHVGQSFTYEGDSGKYHISNPYVQQTTDITYEYRKLGSVELYDENGNYLDQGYRYVNDANDATKASLPEVPEEFPQGDIEYTLVAKEDLPSDLSRSIKYIYRGIETKVTHDTYTLTTKFVDESGNELKAAEPQTITWTTTTKRDIHTNEIISQTSVPSEASYMAVNSPVIAGYYATTPGLGSRKAEQKNATQEIVYRKLGNIIAKDSQGNDLTKVQYENDANDATKIKAIVAPTIKGYHVKSEVVQPSDPGQDTVLNYGEDIQVAQIKYWDKTAHKYITDDQGKDLETIETGAHNTKISHEKVAEQIHALEAKGYKYNSANQEFSTVYFDDDDSKRQTLTVKLIHGTTTELESKQITREIHIHHPKQKEEVVPQTATFTRTGTKDLVTGKTTWNAWSPAQKLAAYTAPKVDGYTADKSVAQLTVNANDEIAPVDIYYTANDQEVLIKYVDVDNNNKEVKSQSLDGVTDQTVDTKYEVPANYELVAGQDLPKAVTFKANGNEPIIVKVKHKKVSVEVGEKDTQNVVTRKITVHRPDGTTKDASQTATFTRTGTKDLVTGKTTWNAWSPAQKLAAYTAPKVDGYTADKSVAQLTVNANDEIAPVDIYYTANDQEVLIKYVDVDNNNKEVKSQSLDGVTDQTVDTKYEVPANYELVAGQDLPKAVTFKAKDNEPIIVKVKHKHQDVTDEYKNDAHKQDKVDHTVTRTVIVKHPHATDDTRTEALHFTRQVTRDMATGQDTFGEWIPDTVDFFEGFAIKPKASDKGYTHDKTSVDRLEHITGDTKDSIVTVGYTANDQKAHVHYIDDTTGKKLEVVHVTGKTDEPIKHDSKAKVQGYLDKGYELVSDGFAKAGKPSYNAEDEDQHFEVHLKHGSKVVKADPSNADSQKEVKRTIIVNAPDGTKTTKVQTVVFTRDGSKDLVTGKISYPDWDEIATKAFSQDDVPQYLGYTSMVAGRKQTTIAAKSVRPTDADQVIEVSYVARPSQQVITYQDENGNQIGTQVITGHTDETVKLVPVLPDGWELLDPDSLSENVTFAPEENPVLVITVKRTATEDSAKTEKTGENTEVAEQEVVNDTTDVTTNEKNEATLPQMGESDTEALAFSLLGLVTAAFSLFYFGKERRKTDN